MTQTFASIEEYEEHLEASPGSYQKMVRSRQFLDRYAELCYRCALAECVRPEGYERDTTLADARRHARRGCPISMVGLRNKPVKYALLHPDEFNLLTDEQIKERWG